MPTGSRVFDRRKETMEARSKFLLGWVAWVLKLLSLGVCVESKAGSVTSSSISTNADGPRAFKTIRHHTLLPAFKRLTTMSLLESHPDAQFAGKRDIHIRYDGNPTRVNVGGSNLKLAGHVI